jgi:hypothetical protein
MTFRSYLRYPVRQHCWESVALPRIASQLPVSFRSGGWAVESTS